MAQKQRTNSIKMKSQSQDTESNNGMISHSCPTIGGLFYSRANSITKGSVQQGILNRGRKSKISMALSPSLYLHYIRIHPFQASE